MNPRKIIRDWLKEHGYDGLYNPVNGCSCLLVVGKLMPWHECPNLTECRAGHLVSPTDWQLEEKQRHRQIVHDGDTFEDPDYGF